MSYLELERRGAGAWARLSRPERANALGPEMVSGLGEWIREAGSDPSVSALVVTGTGKAFCPGADIRASLDMVGRPEERQRFLESGRALTDLIVQAPVPVIAAVNGVAFAGGLELALACDVVVASSAAQFGDLHLPHGRIPAFGSSARLQALGPWRVAEALLLGRRFSALEMQAAGVVSTVTEPAELTAEVDRVVEVLASYEPEALRAMKRLLADQRRAAEQAHLDIEWHHFVEHLARPEMSEEPPPWRDR